MTNHPNRRILVIDDNASIHEDFRKILAPRKADESSLDASEAALFGDDPAPTSQANAGDLLEFQLDSAFQGAEGAKLAGDKLAAGLPYAMAFVDMRMPPGLDGVETIERLWQQDPDLQVVICTAFADYSWPEMIARLGRTDRLLILKKPYDAVEACQLATALTEKWNATRREREQMRAATRAEQEMRAYAASLETVNSALKASWARAEAAAQTHRDFTLSLASEVLAPAGALFSGSFDLRGLESGDPDALERLDQFTRASTGLANALQTVLDLTEIDAGRMVTQSKPCSPWQIAMGVHARAGRAAAGRSVSIELSRKGELPEGIHTDPERVAQVLDSLVDNSLRRTEHGSVRIEVSPCEQHHGVCKHVCFSVSDTGRAFEDQELAYLFEPFGNRKRAGGEPEGSGLGLALAKRLALLLGGDLNLESSPGQGTRFTLVLPLGVAALRS